MTAFFTTSCTAHAAILAGRMAIRIKDQQLRLFAHRASSHRWWHNQFRQLLCCPAYILFEGIRRIVLQTHHYQRLCRTPFDYCL
ncbi:MAG: hypothetical protein GYB33_02975 [Gammaproteobacteria bacterium]|nr:hypothetical protein [Gammaproteobacteria bacterium]